MIFWLWLSCSDPAPAPLFEPPADPLSNTRLLRRISLDIKGTLPTYEEYERVKNDDSELNEITLSYLESPLFEERVMYWMADIWHTRVDEFDIVTDDFDLDSSIWWYSFNRAVGEEPLRLMAFIAANDYPWSEIVTSNYTMSNPLLGDIFPVAYPEGGEGWLPTKYTDGRPPVGVLATNGLWWRYPTNSFNKNRTRAAAITRLLLCDDYLLRPVSFEASPEVLEDTDLALQSDPACLTCHASLDPLAASMFGFWWIEQFNPLEATYYHPEREGMGAAELNTTPAWFGTPVTSFTEVGSHISTDPRFRQCAVQQFSEVLLRRQMDASDHNYLRTLREHFELNLLSVKDLVSAITQSPEYRSASTKGRHKDTRTLKFMTPDILRASIQDFSGYDWTLYDDPYVDYQYRAMAGGVDGFQTFTPQLFPSLTTSLVQKRLAQRASAHLIDNELIQNDSDVFNGVSLNTTPEDEMFRNKLKELRMRLHGHPIDDDWEAQITELWKQAYIIGGSDLAWETIISAMLQDIDYVGY